MISLKQSNSIESYFDKLYPNPKSELNYHNEFQLLVATALSAQTTDQAVNKATAILFIKYPDAQSLAKADLGAVEAIIKPLGLYHNKARYIIDAAQILADKNAFPKTRKELESLPGIGRKCANVLLSNLDIEPAFAVDTHVSRVAKRLGISKDTDSVLVIEQELMKTFNRDSWKRLHHQFVLFGRYLCKAQHPDCIRCELKEFCKYYHP